MYDHERSRAFILVYAVSLIPLRYHAPRSRRNPLRLAIIPIRSVGSSERFVPGFLPPFPQPRVPIGSLPFVFRARPTSSTRQSRRSRTEEAEGRRRGRRRAFSRPRSVFRREPLIVQQRLRRRRTRETSNRLTQSGRRSLRRATRERDRSIDRQM